MTNELQQLLQSILDDLGTITLSINRIRLAIEQITNSHCPGKEPDYISLEEYREQNTIQ